MYLIDSKKDKPDIKYMYSRICKLAENGIRVTDKLRNMQDEFVRATEIEAQQIRSDYAIQNPNSPDQIVGFLKNQGSRVYEVCCDGEKWTTIKKHLGSWLLKVISLH